MEIQIIIIYFATKSEENMSFAELKVEPITNELGDELEKLYLTKKRAFVKVGEKKWYLPYEYAKNSNKLRTFKIRPDDTWIVTYPRSGKSFFILQRNVKVASDHNSYLLILKIYLIFLENLVSLS